MNKKAFALIELIIVIAIVIINSINVKALVFICNDYTIFMI